MAQDKRATGVGMGFIEASLESREGEGIKSQEETLLAPGFPSQVRPSHKENLGAKVQWTEDRRRTNRPLPQLQEQLTFPTFDSNLSNTFKFL